MTWTVILGMGVRSVWYGLASAYRPIASGVVLHSGMTEDQAQEAGTSNTYIFSSADLAFRYQVNGREFTTETIHSGGRLDRATAYGQKD
jgi:hypothetical protein